MSFICQSLQYSSSSAAFFPPVNIRKQFFLAEIIAYRTYGISVIIQVKGRIIKTDQILKKRKNIVYHFLPVFTGMDLQRNLVYKVPFLVQKFNSQLIPPNIIKSQIITFLCKCFLADLTEGYVHTYQSLQYKFFQHERKFKMLVLNFTLFKKPCQISQRRLCY